MKVGVYAYNTLIYIACSISALNTSNTMMDILDVAKVKNAYKCINQINASNCHTIPSYSYTCTNHVDTISQ